MYVRARVCVCVCVFVRVGSCACSSVGCLVNSPEIPAVAVGRRLLSAAALWNFPSDTIAVSCYSFSFDCPSLDCLVFEFDPTKSIRPDSVIRTDEFN